MVDAKAEREQMKWGARCWEHTIGLNWSHDLSTGQHMSEHTGEMLKWKSRSPCHHCVVWEHSAVCLWYWWSSTAGLQTAQFKSDSCIAYKLPFSLAPRCSQGNVASTCSVKWVSGMKALFERCSHKYGWVQAVPSQPCREEDRTWWGREESSRVQARFSVVIYSPWFRNVLEESGKLYPAQVFFPKHFSGSLRTVVCCVFLK